MRAALFLPIACLVAGCASVELAPAVAPAADSAEAPSQQQAVEQALFRLSYHGVDGRGRLRLVLRSQGSDFHLEAADPFGRSLWSFGTHGSEAVLLDHRESTYCRLEGAVTIDVVALSELPVRSLPLLLSGRLPADLAEPLDPPDSGEIDVVDRAGRRWTARFDRAELVAWTLYEGGEPTLWWKLQGEGGLLSHRDGAQASWIRTASERVNDTLEPLEPPAGYMPYRCTRDDGDDLA